MVKKNYKKFGGYKNLYYFYFNKTKQLWKIQQS